MTAIETALIIMLNMDTAKKMCRIAQEVNKKSNLFIFLKFCHTVSLCERERESKREKFSLIFTSHVCDFQFDPGMTQMAPEFAQLLETKDMEMQQQQHGQGPSVYNVPQMKTFYQKKDPVAPYATTTLINTSGNAVGGGGHSLQDHMFRPITQHSQQSGSGDSGCCKHECSGDSNTSHSNTGEN